VHLLTELGFDTGFSTKDAYNLPSSSFGGLEFDFRNPATPYIVKSLMLCDRMQEVLNSKEIILDHLIVPMRDLHDAAESRRRVSTLGEVAGGLWKTNSMDKGVQENILANQLYKLLVSAASAHVPVTLLLFPLLAFDKEYLFVKLLFLMEPAGVTYEDFSAAFDLTSAPERIHFF
jgi:hypothetical protein